MWNNLVAQVETDLKTDFPKSTSATDNYHKQVTQRLNEMRVRADEHLTMFGLLNGLIISPHPGCRGKQCDHSKHEARV